MRMPTIIHESSEERKESANTSHATQMRAYREIHGKEINAKRWGQIPEFIGVDSEGVGKDINHRTVLLSVGDQSHIADDQSIGLQWAEVFDFLWEQYLEHKRAAFVGFSLGYDFNRWLMSLPREKAWLLLTEEGRYKRIPKIRMGRFTKYPVRIPTVSRYTNYGWEVEMLAFKALTIKPMICDCMLHEPYKCTHKKEKAALGTLTVCDTFAFFGEAFLSVINPKNWKMEPMGPPVTQEEYDIIEYGKNNLRTDQTEVTPDMEVYNRTENKALAAVMSRLAKGLIDIGIHLKKDEWYGPGATAAAWLKMKGALKKDQLIELYPELENILPIFEKSYYGGWFEIFSHGIIPDISYNYDINNAYPFAIAKLPLMDGIWRRGSGSNIPATGSQEFILCYAKCVSKGNRIGAMPHRRKDGSIIRPKVTVGWYWLHEIKAAERAGILESYTVTEWMQYIPRTDEKPFADIEEMYYERLRFGKKSAKGLAIKLTNNSDYGKFAQTVGMAPYNNWFYASYITSHCRTQILDAIATHPDKANAVLMVATDGVIFDSPHTLIDAEIERFAADNPIDLNGNTRILDDSGEDKRDDRLGYWEKKTYTNLRIFKPGVYWDKDGLQKIGNVKARGIPKKHFAESVSDAEWVFYEWQDQKAFYIEIEGENEIVDSTGAPVAIRENGWPLIYTEVEFSFISCQQALQGGEENWKKAGQVKPQWRIIQSSNPTVDGGKKGKRQSPHWNHKKSRMDTNYIKEENVISTPYSESIIPPIDFSDDYFTLDGELVASLGIMFRAIHGDSALDSEARHSEY